MGTEATLLAFSSSLRKFSWNRLWGTFCSSRRRGRCDCRPRQNCAIVESSVRGEESGTRISGSFASANRLHSLARGSQRWTLSERPEQRYPIRRGTLLGSRGRGWREGERVLTLTDVTSLYRDFLHDRRKPAILPGEIRHIGIPEMARSRVIV